MERIIAYIDGYNLYHGLKESKLRKFYWLDVKKLIESILRPDQTLVHVNYFTSRVSDPPTKLKRQNTYLEALATLPKLYIHYGHYVVSKTTCRHCGATQASRREKRTDVNIAAVMLFDAFKNNCDNAILVSADTDLLGPLKVMKQMFPNRKRTLAFPPCRYSDQLKNAATGWLHIGEDKFAKSLLPAEVISKTGFKLVKPTYWP